MCHDGRFRHFIDRENPSVLLLRNPAQTRWLQKKPVQKLPIEDLVVNEVLAILTDDYIDAIAQEIADLSATEGNTDTTIRLKRLLKENEEATANLIKAIETGKAVDILSAQIEKRQAERVDLEVQLAQEKLLSPVLTYKEIKFFFDKFKGGDASDTAYRMVLVDTFVNKIYLYDGDDARFEIFCKASEQKISCPIDEPLRSPMGQLARPARFERTTYRLGGDRSILLSYGRIDRI